MRYLRAGLACLTNLKNVTGLKHRALRGGVAHEQADDCAALCAVMIESGDGMVSAVALKTADLMMYRKMLEVALEEARQGRAEGGVPIGAALFRRSGELISRGHNRRVQDGDPSIHGETDAFRRAGRQRSYRDMVMVTTLAPCWYCSGLVRQFRIGTLVVGESRTFAGGLDWLRAHDVNVIDLDDAACRELLEAFIAERPEVWNEDIGEE
jgi:cytosine/creatinine deaminase